MKHILSIFLMGIFLQFSSQEAKVQDLFGVESELLLPKAGISFEKAIGNTFSIKPIVLYGLGGLFSSSNSDTETISTLFTSLQFRHYTNLKRRVDLGKSIANNTGSFIMLDLSYIPDIATSTTIDNIVLLRSFSASLVYGLQRQMFKSGLSWHFRAGLGVQFEEDRKDVFGDGDTYLIPTLNTGFNYLIPIGKK